MRRLDQRGETLVEVVMALGILSLVLVSSYALATGTFRLGRGAGERTQAVNYLQQQAEALRAYRNEVTWTPEFKDGMRPYLSETPLGTFCMTKKDVSGIMRWRPVDTATNQAACKVDGTTITIHPTPEGIQQKQYKFDLKATWKTGSQDNNVTLTTKLTDQTP